MRSIILALLSLLHMKDADGQVFNENIDRDSLFMVLVKELPDTERIEMEELYFKGDVTTKDFFLFMLNMPRSSKKELIDNYERKATEITALVNTYALMVPADKIVGIEFNPGDPIFNMEPSIDIRVLQKGSDGRHQMIRQEWNMSHGSEDLNTMLGMIGWDMASLTEIEHLLNSANCISITNGEYTTVGFARSGMGKYSYKIFPADLDEESRASYNNGCHSIFHRDNIVLEYGGGATGPQCFPD